MGECLPKFDSNIFFFQSAIKNVKLRYAVLKFCLMFCLVLKIGLSHWQKNVERGRVRPEY